MSANNYFTSEDLKDSDETTDWIKSPQIESFLSEIMAGILLLPLGIGILILARVYIKYTYTAYLGTSKALYLKKDGLLFQENVFRLTKFKKHHIASHLLKDNLDTEPFKLVQQVLVGTT